MLPRNVAVVGAIVALVASAATARAQQTVTIRYQPPLSRTIQTRTDVHTMVTLNGFPSVPDGSTLEEEVLIGATQRTLGPGTGGTAVEVTVDSVRGRNRLAGGGWHDLVTPPLAAGMARAVVSDRFEVVGIQSKGEADADVLQALGGFVIGLGFSFPNEPIAVGATVPTGGRVRVRVQTDSSTGLVLDEVMLGDLAITLDSVVHDPGDDLSYFEFRGDFAPRAGSATSESGGGTSSYAGGFAGRFVWSSGWNAIASAAVRVRVEGRIHSEGPRGQQDAQVTWDRTIIHRLRP
jgi:hypothetical protein